MTVKGVLGRRGSGENQRGLARTLSHAKLFLGHTTNSTSNTTRIFVAAPPDFLQLRIDQSLCLQRRRSSVRPRRTSPSVHKSAKVGSRANDAMLI